MLSDIEFCRRSLYAAPRVYAWIKVNPRKQRIDLVAAEGSRAAGVGPLLSRYLFAGFRAWQSPRMMRSTLVELYLVHYGSEAARLPVEVVQVRGRRGAYEGVIVYDALAPDPLFARCERERTRVLVRSVEAGWSVQVG